MASDITTEPTTDPRIEADEQAVWESYLTGKRLDPEVARRVHERAMQIRDEAFRKHGLVDIAVPAFRELRGELPT